MLAEVVGEEDEEEKDAGDVLAEMRGRWKGGRHRGGGGGGRERERHRRRRRKRRGRKGERKGGTGGGEDGGGGGGAGVALTKPYPSLPSKVKPNSWPPSW